MPGLFKTYRVICKWLHLTWKALHRGAPITLLTPASVPVIRFSVPGRPTHPEHSLLTRSHKHQGKPTEVSQPTLPHPAPGVYLFPH